MRLELKKGLLFLFCSVFLFSFSSFGQTISLSDFANEVKKDKVDKGAKKAVKKEALKILRDNQLGLSLQIFGSITGISKVSFDENYFSEGVSNFKSSLLKGYDVRLSYTKESFIPFGIYAGYGNANLFLGGAEYEISYDTVGMDFGSSNITVTPNSDNYFLIGLSKNLSFNSTVYLGYMGFLTKVVRGDFLQNTSLREEAGVNFGFSYKLNNIIFSLDNIIHLPYYKESDFFYNNFSYYSDGVENQQSQTFGNRFQIGLGYIF
tara:strand:+ start:1084 stop:1872 length:789 start_codon:yes stop_codon:yes gene_type:complete